MAKARTLDTPFRRGEKVQTVHKVDDVAEGARGKIQLSNGLGEWRRYWVRFEDGEIRGQISHESLVRPSQWGDWLRREEEREQAALRSADEAEAAAEVAASSAGDAGGGGGSDLASKIPAHLLERSQAAKARLLGG
ncbi:MAG: hypothetical protein AAF467_05195 [Actinomycetota bacterium]